MKPPKLILVGAGPGDEELITLKGIKALQNADVVLYDALANPKLLSHAPPSALRAFVGKRAGLHHYQQFLINKMIVEYANKYGTVVRLKGGDPFIFGRGHEEIEYSVKHGLQVELVPGVSSATAVPALQNIPLTKRNISESFWVVTGTTKKGELSQDLHRAARSSATIIVLMGMKKLTAIATIIMKYRGPHEPVAIIQNGSCKNEKFASGKISNIADMVNKKRLGTPAIMVIGKVVNERVLNKSISGMVP